jgi:hypothetical protein
MNPHTHANPLEIMPPTKFKDGPIRSPSTSPLSPQPRSQHSSKHNIPTPTASPGKPFPPNCLALPTITSLLRAAPTSLSEVLTSSITPRHRHTHTTTNSRLSRPEIFFISLLPRREHPYTDISPRFRLRSALQRGSWRCRGGDVLGYMGLGKAGSAAARVLGIGGVKCAGAGGHLERGDRRVGGG